MKFHMTFQADAPAQIDAGREYHPPALRHGSGIDGLLDRGSVKAIADGFRQLKPSECAERIMVLNSSGGIPTIAYGIADLVRKFDFDTEVANLQREMVMHAMEAAKLKKNWKSLHMLKKSKPAKGKGKR